MGITLEHRCVHARVLLPALARAPAPISSTSDGTRRFVHEGKSGGGRDLFVPLSPDRDTAPLR